MRKGLSSSGSRSKHRKGSLRKMSQENMNEDGVALKESKKSKGDCYNVDAKDNTKHKELENKNTQITLQNVN